MKSPNEIAETMRKALQDRNYMAFVDCFADDGVYELPYALKGKPHVLSGIDQIRALFSNNMTARNQLFEMRKVNLRTHNAADPDVIFAEFFLEGKLTSTGEEFALPSSMAIITCRDGKVANYRDFPNVAGISQAIGLLGQYADSLKQ